MADDIGFPEVEETTNELDTGEAVKAKQPKQRPAKAYGQKKAKPGPLLMDYEGDEVKERKLADLAIRMWKAQDNQLERPQAQWGVNAARRAGFSNAKVRRGQDEHWTVWLPKNATPDTTPDVNKAATLCRRMTSQVFTDPFVAEVVVPDGDDDAADAAELAERALQDMQDEHGMNTNAKARRAFDRSHTYGSGWEHLFVDDRGGGSRVVKLQARADAINAELALVDPLTGMQGPQLDPLTGGPVPLAERMVTESGDFTDDVEEAAVEYLAKLKSEVLDGRYVRLLPATAPDVWEADGAMIAAMPTWSEVKDMDPRVATLDEPKIRKILGFRPQFATDLIPGGEDNEKQTIGSDDAGNPIWNDQRPVFVQTTYYKRCADYPKGLKLITIGGCYVMYRGNWQDESGEEPRTLDIPLSQYYAFDEGRDGYWKVGLMELIGRGNEALVAQLVGLIDHLEKFNNQPTFVPTNSIIEEEDMVGPRKRFIRVNPGGEPKQLPVPPWPIDSYNVMEGLKIDMEQASGLREQSGEQGQSNVKSGRHEFALISQVHAGLSEVRQNIERGFVRSSRIALQLARAFLDSEQTARWGTMGGRYRETAWRGSDLSESADVRIKPGSGTMLAPAAKAQLAERYASMQVLDMDELREVITTNIGGTVGLQDDPHRLRIKSQIAAWSDGPPEGWDVPPEQVIQMPDPAQVLQAQQTGTPPPPPMIVEPTLARMWEPVPVDTVPVVALKRFKAIGDKMATPLYLSKPPGWRAALDLEYQRMQQALAPLPDVASGPGAQDEAKKAGEGPVNKDGTPPNDLQEDALQEGADPAMVLG